MANNCKITQKHMEYSIKKHSYFPPDTPLNRYIIAKRDVYTIQDSTGFIWGYTPDLAKAKKIQALAKKRTDKVVGIIKGNILPLPKKYKMPLKKDYKSTPKVAKSTQKNVKITPKKESKMARKSTKRKKLSGNALKQKAYALIKKGVAKLVAANGRGKKVNTRYAGKKRVGVYVYKLKSRKK